MLNGTSFLSVQTARMYNAGLVSAEREDRGHGFEEY